MKKQMIRNTRTRQALIDAFRILVNQRDYDEITVKEITELAEVNRNSFYNYFKNIDDLLHDIVFERIVGCYYVEETGHWCGWEESAEKLTGFFEDDDNRGFIADVFRGADGFRRAFFYEVCLCILDLAGQYCGLQISHEQKIFLAGGLSARLTDWLFSQRSIPPRAFVENLYAQLRPQMSGDAGRRTEIA